MKHSALPPRKGRQKRMNSMNGQSNASHSDTTGQVLSTLPGNGLLAPLPDDPTSLLTVKEIAERLRVTYDRLRGFADAPGVKTAVGAITVKGVKGVRYPLSALDLFANLIQAQDEGLIEPATAGAWLAKTRRDDPGAAIGVVAPSPNDSTLLPVAALNQAQIVALVVGAIKQAAQEIVAERGLIPTPDDCLLTTQQVADILQCSPRRVHLRVAPVLRGRYKKSHVMAYIAAL